MPVGTYYVTATDSYGCEQIDSATLVMGTSIDLFMESSDPFCNGSMNGRAVASPTNGTPPYLYLWSNGDTTQAISGLESCKALILCFCR
ncbi:MAG: SprB repeat-containing protein [Saprospiraceae bacterium]